MECLFYDVPISCLHRFPRAATREHLIPRGRCNFIDIQARENVVICSSFMNNLLGDAPLMVKMEVRQTLLKNHLTDHSDIENIAKNILDSYRVDNRFPWQVASFNSKELKSIKKYMREVEELEVKLFMALSQLRKFPVQPIIDWSGYGGTDAMAASK